MAVAAAFAAEQLRGFVPERTSPTFSAIDEGTLLFKDRRLPAGVVKATWTTVNRAEGEKRSICVYQMGGHDPEYAMWRNLATVRCDATDAAKRIARWKQAVEFQRIAVSGEDLPALPPGPIVDVIQRRVRFPHGLLADATGQAWFTNDTDGPGRFSGRLWTRQGAGPDAGSPKVVLESDRVLIPLALAGDHVVVYIGAGSPDARAFELARVHRETGAQVKVTSDVGVELAAAISGDSLLWLSSKDYGATASRLMRHSLSSSEAPPTTVATLSFLASALAVDGNSTFVIGTRRPKDCRDEDRVIRGVRESVCVEQCLVSEIKSAVASAPRPIGLGSCTKLGIAGDRLLIGFEESVVVAGRDGGSVTKLADCNAWAVRDNVLFCSFHKTESIGSLLVSGGPSTTLVDIGQRPESMTASEGYLIWTSGKRTPEGSNPEEFAGGVYAMRL